jgi:putative CocE/NonD family hydrolase
MHAGTAGMAESLRESIALFQKTFGLTAPTPAKRPVRLFLMGANEWREYESWPVPNSTPQTLYLHQGGALSASAPNNAAVSVFDYNPAQPTPSFHGPTLEGRTGSGDMAELERRSDVLVFTSEPQTGPLDVIGSISAEVYLRSSTEHTDLYLCLCDVTPASRSTNVCDGYRRLRPSDATILPDGRTRKVSVEFWPTAYRFQAGHRLRVIVASGAHPRYVRNPGTAESLGEAQSMIIAHQQVLHGQEHSTSITLSVIGQRA